MNPNPRFTGIFIPVEILEMEDLTLLDQLLLSWIDALYSKEHGGCFAKNDYLADRLRVKENTIAKALTKLRQKGLIEDVSFDGRHRIIRAKVGKFVEESQSNPALDLNPTQTWTKIQPSIGLESKPIIIYRKEDSKEDIYKRQGANTHLGLDSSSSENSKHKTQKQTPESRKVPPTSDNVCGVAKPKKITISRLHNVATAKEEHDTLIAKYGENFTNRCYEELSTWKESADPKKVKAHKDDYYRINKWIVKSLKEQDLKDQELKFREEKLKNPGKNPYEKPIDAIRREQTKRYIEANGNPNDNPNLLKFE